MPGSTEDGKQPPLSIKVESVCGSSLTLGVNYYQRSLAPSPPPPQSPPPTQFSSPPNCPSGGPQTCRPPLGSRWCTFSRVPSVGADTYPEAKDKSPAPPPPPPL